MLKFAVLNDLHFADQPPLGRRPGYREQLLAKLAGVLTEMEEHEVDKLIITGDVFHIKRPDRVSYRLTNRLIDIFKNETEADVYICPGNHDLSEAGIDSLENQPLGAVFAAEAALPLIQGQSYFLRDRRNRVNAMLIGRHYATAGDCDPFYYVVTDEEEREYQRAGCNFLIMVAHGSIVPPGEAPPYPHIAADKIPWQESDLVPDILLAGHLHENWGYHKIKDGPLYVNLGSFGRPSRNKTQMVDTREYAIVVVDDDLRIKLATGAIPNMLPAADVFLEKVEEMEDEELAEFAEQLASSIVLEDTPIDEALDALGDIPPAVRDRLKHYLEEAGL